MSTLNTVVQKVVESFMKDEELFTAFDVSNKVKLSQPLARHGEVRDAVRELFTTVLQPASWARSPIKVTLTDGSQQTALLYHPISNSWDLDYIYNKQSQATVKTMSSKPTQTVGVSIPLPVKDQWANLFNSQPSLFPRK